LTTERHDKGNDADSGGSDRASELGPRLRAVRLRQGIGLRELARRLDLSPSSISQIETGKIRPSVSTLYALASEFGVTVDELLFDEPRLLRGSAIKPTRDALALNEPKLTVQRADEHPMINLSSGVQWERLMLWADEDVEFLEATYEPGGASSPDDSFVRHSGHEFGFILSGTLRVIVGFDEFILEPGDSITFPSTTPHRLSNDGPETVRAVWVTRGRSGADDAREQTESPVVTQVRAGNGRHSGESAP
jgi:transcriptional regulator with XRE-family HTH domain